jgi:ParB family transcriptional regulator, chromosome partitioning protein
MRKPAVVSIKWRGRASERRSDGAVALCHRPRARGGEQRRIGGSPRRRSRSRRQHTPLELVRAIGALRERGYSHPEIAAKVDLSSDYVGAICYLLENGEEKLINAIERGVMPHSIAMEIARAKEGEVQRALAQAYEDKAIPGNQVLAIRQIIEQRNTSGKGTHTGSPGARHTSKPVTSESLIRAYQKETERQKLLVKRASLARSRLLFVSNALKRLLTDKRQSTSGSRHRCRSRDRWSGSR